MRGEEREGWSGAVAASSKRPPATREAILTPAMARRKVGGTDFRLIDVGVSLFYR